MPSRQTKPSVKTPSRWFVLGAFAFAFLGPSEAWAYKVERVCEMTEPTSKKPSVKVCKTLLVKPAPASKDGKDDKKDAKKEEKPAAGHH